jgi:CBS domain-containing protein
LLVAAGTRASHVTEYLATLGDAVLDRLVMFAQRDLGPAPVPFTFLALGSHGRREQTLATDQDNALLYADPAAGHAAVCASYFLALGVRVCDGLHATGYTYCRGEVMARNPKWCKPLGEWRALFSDWLEHSTAEALQAVNIVFDFRPAAGDDALAADLRRHLLQAAESREVFFHNLARSTLEFKPPLGFFGKIVTETGGRHPETVDLKNGLVPIVNFARVYSLQHGLAATGTLARIEQLTTAGVLLPGSAAELRVAFDTLAALRLRHQAAQVASGEAPDNRVNLHALTEIEQTTLRKVFEQITVFQAKLRLDFAGTL